MKFQKKARPRIVFAAGVLVFIFSQGVAAVQAQSTAIPTQPSLSAKPFDLGVSPPTTYLQIAPGSKKTLAISIEQQGTLPLEVTPSLVDFTSDGLTGQPVLGNGSSFRHITLTLPGEQQPNKTSFLLQPKEKKSLTLTIDIPEQEPEQEHHLTLLFRAQVPDDIVLGSGSEVSGVVGSNIIILTSHSERDRGLLELSKYDIPKFVDSFSRLTFSGVVKNTGLNATTASGSATVTDWRGTQVAEYPLYPDMVLADTARQLRTAPSIEQALAQPEKIADEFIFSAPFLLGPYQVTISVIQSSQDSTQISQVTKTVIAAPFSVILVMISCGLIYAFYRYSIQNNTVNSPELEKYDEKN